MEQKIEYDGSRMAWIISGAIVDERFRVSLSREFIEDKVGDDASEDQRVTWIRQNLPQILQAYTARREGGWVKEPWNRVLVEEIS